MTAWYNSDSLGGSTVQVLMVTILGACGKDYMSSITVVRYYATPQLFYLLE